MQTAALVVTYTTTAAAWLFIAMYHLMSKGGWRFDPVGRHLMAMVAVDAGIFTMLTAANLWPYLALQRWYQWTYLGVVSGIAVVTVWRAAILWRLNRNGRQPDGR